MLKVGIVGTGVIAEEHARSIAMVPESARLVVAADVDADRLARFAREHSVPASHATAEKLIADPQVDLVAIATPPSSHEALAVAALEAGKFVLCEKPLAHSLESARRIVEAARRKPGRLAVSYQMRYDPWYSRLVWLATSRTLGDLRGARLERHSPLPKPRDGAYGWWGQWNVSGGGVLITQLIHELDVLIQALGKPLSVRARMDTRHAAIESEDYIEAAFSFPGGVVAECIASANSGVARGGLSIDGAEGSVGLPWRLVLDRADVAPATLARLRSMAPEEWLPSRSFAARLGRLLARKLGIAPRPPLTAHARLYRDLAESAAAGRPLPIPAEDAWVSLEACMAAYESAITGAEVTLPLGEWSAVFRGVTPDAYAARKVRPAPAPRAATRLRVGLVGLDTSHASAFANLLHDPAFPLHLPGACVAAAYPGGSADMPISASRVDGFTQELRGKHGIPIVDSPERVARESDVVFILSSDGRTHPALLRAVAGEGCRVFVDKPFAISVKDAEDMLAIARHTGTRLFAASAFRYADALVAALRDIRDMGETVKGCVVRFWLQVQETQGRYFWYGIHAAEMLSTCMGRGVAEVEVTSPSATQDRIQVRYADGREATLVGTTNDGTFAVELQTDRRKVAVDLASSNPSLAARILWAALDNLAGDDYPRLWRATPQGSVRGERPGRPFDPTLEDTLETVRILEAAQESQRSGRKVVI